MEPEMVVLGLACASLALRRAWNYGRMWCCLLGRLLTSQVDKMAAGGGWGHPGDALEEVMYSVITLGC